ncbi:MAG: peroxiredoxin [Thiogranum sp.]|nr:peroxiredoxin [Thiogranum sp.]
MADKLMIVIANSDLARTAELAAPLTQAAVAAAMEYETEIIFTGGCCALARPGVATQLMIGSGTDKSVQDLIREAHDAGVSFKLCTPPQETWNGELIDEIDESVGNAYLISEAMDDATVTFTY